MESILKYVGSMIMSLALFIGKPLGMFTSGENSPAPLGVTAEDWTYMKDSPDAHRVYKLTYGFVALVTILFSCVILPMVMKLFTKKRTRRKSKSKKRVYRRK